ncbi:jg27124 [Pararge aegeria aegeria]|uniref:Jg27124 protein n=1 Tax=Pararge aegeria aegeria TaxID=348720 RepID=A0A8S4QNP8_9NEOP|nr:jg27124 [Pararge aegeria aegeria]
MDAEHPAFNKSIDYSCIDSLNLETMQKHRIEGAFIFTDGSKIKGKVGAAISVWEGGGETKAIKLQQEQEPFCTVFQAELYALDSHIKDKNIQKSNLYSDSKSSLDLLKKHTITHSLACSIRKNLIAIQKQGKALHIFLVKAHVSVEGNEKVDHLAKEAALYKRTKADYDACPIA